MIRFLRHLRAAWHYATHVPILLPQDHEDEWNKADSRAYTAFMESPTGLKLKARSMAFIIQSALNSTQHTQASQFGNGWASGVRATFSWLDGHASREEEPEEQEEQPPVDISERFRP